MPGARIVPHESPPRHPGAAKWSVLLADDLDRLERAVFSPDEDVDVATIYALKRETLEAKRAATPLVEPLQRLMRSRLVPEQAVPFFRDINDHLLRVVDRAGHAGRLQLRRR